MNSIYKFISHTDIFHVSSFTLGVCVTFGVCFLTHIIIIKPKLRLRNSSSDSSCNAEESWEQLSEDDLEEDESDNLTQYKMVWFSFYARFISLIFVLNSSLVNRLFV